MRVGLPGCFTSNFEFTTLITENNNGIIVIAVVIASRVISVRWALGLFKLT